MNVAHEPLVAALVVSSAAAAAWALARPLGWPRACLLGFAVAVPGSIAGDPVLAPALAGAALLGRYWLRSGRITAAAFRGMPSQAATIGAGYLAYIVGRVLVRSGPAEALANAREVVRFERALGLWIEPGIQDALGHGLSASILNHVYLSWYYPVPAVALVVFFLRDRYGYRVLRDSLAVSAVLALVAIALVPTAPPRLVPGLGIFDTIEAAGGERALANQFAAIPSLHVGWPALVGLMLAVRGPSWAKVLSPLPGGLMALTVIATGNHYWFDAVVGIAVSAGPALYFMSVRQEDYLPEPGPARERPL